jgi:hypothetical protein
MAVQANRKKNSSELPHKPPRLCTLGDMTVISSAVGNTGSIDGAMGKGARGSMRTTGL